ncbi:unnamed protein product [Brachionus calyciflorus]|uniref:Uncharacterized protein n=1 Tax=Brachionus calyciflorus TaxID=104777 RepID=A0A813M4E3_9BILA|nr:unnamed protein product [Brachionus calyciflorus]
MIKKASKEFKYKLLENDDFELDQSEIKLDSKFTPIVRDLNGNSVVTNPYFDKDLFNDQQNSNNSNNNKRARRSRSLENRCSSRNSILQIITKTLNSMVTTDGTNGDECDVKVNKNDQIELKITIPRHLFNDKGFSKYKKNCDSDFEEQNSGYFSDPEPTEVEKKTSCLVFLICLCILLNPLIGLTALSSYLKSCKCNEIESKKFLNQSKNRSIFGIVSGLFLLGLGLLLFYFYQKFFSLFKLEEFNRLEINQSNQSNLILNHKLHFKITHLDDVQPTTSSSRLIRENTNSTSTRLTTVYYSTITTSLSSSTESQNSTVQLYDRLNILIDHDLFEMIRAKYKISKLKRKR